MIGDIENKVMQMMDWGVFSTTMSHLGYRCVG